MSSSENPIGGLIRAGLWSAYPSRTRPGAERVVPATLAVVLLVVLWWVITASGAVAPLYLPNPLDVLGAMAGQLGSGVMWRYLTPTLLAAVLGSMIAIAIAIPLGLFIAHSKLLAAVLEPFVAVSQTVPMVAIAPLLVLWIGYGTAPIAVLCAVIAFFPMLTTTVVGLRHLDMRVVENAVLDGARWWQLLLHIEGPMAAPAVLAGIRGGVVLSMTGAIVGEYVMGGEGLGALLTLSRQTSDTTAVFATVAWLSMAAMLLHAVVYLAERSAAAKLQGEHS